MLTEQQISAIQALQNECEKAENIQLKLNWEMLRRRENTSMDFFRFKGEELVGYLALYKFGSTVEVCGMVKPELRRNNIFTDLWSQALQVIDEKQFKKILLNAPSASTTAKGWIGSQPSKYSFSEYQMVWNPCPLQTHHDITLRPSQAADSELEIALDMDGFGMDEADARHHHSTVQALSDKKRYIIELNNGVMVGKLRVSYEGNEAWIAGFVVQSGHRGKGIGRKALETIVKQEHDAGYVVRLEVEAKNERALQLYKSIGFNVIQGQDYYEYIRE